ncbi:DUF4873 domain-containing protein [Actinocatenispora sera]|uniref:DUF4873 domain-containing protein n=1 Tax=Actinocatenispora sera TaxID=390989 RepID=A0A810L9I9_9ACTN|nr:DUF4873 domain-containing protein [Actinocatenispora sera]BCJ31943.1 DUF4873 domain-containing protein [Actinocatenispora sera]
MTDEPTRSGDAGPAAVTSTATGSHEPDGDGYRGEVELGDGARSVRVGAELRGALEPISGAYRWYGRLAADPAITGLATSQARNLTLTTPYGSVTTTLTDADPWGRYRVGGTGRPPFPVSTTPAF